MLPAVELQRTYRRLLRGFGRQHWWPARSPFEVMVGAILTQNTAWTNVERAIARLEAADLLEPAAMLATPAAVLAEAIRPAGYYNVKAERLHGYCRAYLAEGGLEALRRRETADLREWLLGIRGVGRETADAILLYAFERPIFVVDAYARRVFARLGWLGGGEHYDRLREAVEQALPGPAPVYNELHALLVELGKRHCRPRPRCAGCPLAAACPSRVAGAVAG